LPTIVSVFAVALAGGCGPTVHPEEIGAYAALAELGAEMDLSPEGRIASVELSRTQVTDDDLRHLDRLPRVWCVSLYDTQVTDRGLKFLAHLHNLKWLDVENTAVTGTGLRELTGLEKIITVWAGGTGVTSEEFEQLENAMPNTTFRR